MYIITTVDGFFIHTTSSRFSLTIVRFSDNLHNNDDAIKILIWPPAIRINIYTCISLAKIVFVTFMYSLVQAKGWARAGQN